MKTQQFTLYILTKAKLIIILLAILVIITSCKKVIEVEPPNNALTSDNVYNDDGSAAAFITSLYSKISSSGSIGATDRTIPGISIRAGLSADELTLFGGKASNVAILIPFYTNSLTSSNTSTIWAECYNNLYFVNLAIERLTAASALTPAVRQQLLGESKFLRAFFLFYLTNLYGDIPLNISSDYRITSTLSNSSKDQIYSQIISDLLEAKDLLSDRYLKADCLTPYPSGSEERIRPTKWSSIALLAKAYLFNQDYTDAEAQATILINNSALFSLQTPNSVFLKNSKEAIWQLQPVNAGWNTEDAKVFVLPTGGPNTSSYPVFLDSVNMVRAFEIGDLRKNSWVGKVTPSSGITYYFPYKYKNATLNSQVSEYLMVFRLAEQYLIRAEARAQLNNINGSQADLNTIRSRAGLPATSANDQQSLLKAILHERQVELFTEWGNRWLDLKRTSTIDSVMKIVAPMKSTTWSTNWKNYPIPLYDIQQNPNLSQNSGY